MTEEPLRIRFVPGVMPDRWLRTWAQRVPRSPLDARPVAVVEQTAVLHDRAADMCFVRLPIDRAGLHLIPLYEEEPVVVVPRDHPVAAFAEVDLADLVGEHLLPDPVDLPGRREPGAEPGPRASEAAGQAGLTVGQAVELVAARTGLLLLPMSLARLHHRKDVVHRRVTGVAPSAVGLAWRADDDDPRLETFIGIVRGRTERSTRGRPAPEAGGRRTEREATATPRRGQGERRTPRPAGRRGRRRR